MARQIISMAVLHPLCHGIGCDRQHFADPFLSPVGISVARVTLVLSTVYMGRGRLKQGSLV